MPRRCAAHARRAKSRCARCGMFYAALRQRDMFIEEHEHITMPLCASMSLRCCHAAAFCQHKSRATCLGALRDIADAYAMPPLLLDLPSRRHDFATPHAAAAPTIACRLSPRCCRRRFSLMITPRIFAALSPLRRAISPDYDRLRRYAAASSLLMIEMLIAFSLPHTAICRLRGYAAAFDAAAFRQITP